MHESQESPEKKQHLTAEKENPGILHSEARLDQRRRLIKGGFAAPVLMTLVSRRALGTNSQCQTGSMMTSMNTSHAHANLPICAGHKPPHWCDNKNYSDWRSPCVPKKKVVSGKTYDPTLFHSSESGFLKGTWSMGSKTMVEVLALDNSSGANQVAAYCAAALLNAMSGLTPVLDVGGVRGVWNDYVRKGYYEPTAGVRWYASQIVQFLKQTQPG